ncbi:hypothetical protein [Campylobacter sp. CCUG 57310]|uniref:hypothetical protein n=1 Tax=Campylobacter sp. CCUG 57310 TaxID=2517362 RepID=UPI001563481A|nr:hypothetical protein [Campylobacter sp. CCUG 57310]QKF93134.1 hypothetical protein CORI_1982 [Campylobacter sp. CCUG 57310]
MNLTFEIEDELDLVDQLQPAIEAIAHIVEALPYYGREGINHERDISTANFISDLLFGISGAIAKYQEQETAKRKETK